MDKTIVQPRRLVMIVTRCFYCESTNQSELFQTCVSRLHGIIHCDAHRMDAVRDCNVYKHQKRIVSMYDLKKIPDLAALEDLLNSNSFGVRRSNGTVETGWKLDYGSQMEPQFIIYSSTVNQWMIPVVSGDEESFKHIPISEITDPLLFDQTVFATAIRALDRGVYLD